VVDFPKRRREGKNRFPTSFKLICVLSGSFLDRLIQNLCGFEQKHAKEAKESRAHFPCGIFATKIWERGPRFIFFSISSLINLLRIRTTFRLLSRAKRLIARDAVEAWPISGYSILCDLGMGIPITFTRTDLFSGGFC